VDTNLPTVSVVLPAKEASASLPRALRSISEQTYPNIVDVIVAAADEGSASGLPGDVVVVPNPKGSTPAGLNLAIAAARGDVVVRCDAQAVLPPEYVAAAVSTLVSTGADNVGGMQIPVGETNWERAIAAGMSSPWGAGDARYRVGGAPGPVETVYLGTYRRETLERLGGFDEAFTRTQDYELNHRIVASGGVVWFEPSLRVEYRPRGSLAALASQYLQYGRAKRRFARKHPGSLRWRQLAAPLLVAILATSLVASIWIPLLLVVPAGYVAGLLLVGMTAGASPWRVAAALATMHLSWGFGFLRNDGT